MSHLLPPNDGAATLSPLPIDLHKGLTVVSSLGSLSFVCSTSLFCFLTYRFLSWSLDRRIKPSAYRTNQFLVLIYNLLLADIQQSLAFLLNVSAVANDAIIVDIPTCWAQGWFVSTGDLASSVWIFAIALHTFLIVIKDFKIPQYWFYVSIVCLWSFIYGMALVGVAMHPRDFYSRAGPWCWINSLYDDLRLWLHYLWLFICMFGTVMIYALIVTTLAFRLHMRESPGHISLPISSGPAKKAPPGMRLHSEDTTLARSDTHGVTELNNKTTQRAMAYLIVYPLIYVICTIPLAAGRIAAMTGVDVSDHYFCIAGGMIASNGFLDVVLYGFTRGSLVFGWRDAEGRGVDAGQLETFKWYSGSGATGTGSFGTITIIEGGGGHARPDAAEAAKGADGMSVDGERRTASALGRRTTNALSHMKRSRSGPGGSKRIRRGTTASTEDLYHKGHNGGASGAGSSSTSPFGGGGGLGGGGGGSGMGLVANEMYMAGGGIKTETTVDVKIDERRGGPYELRDVGGLGGGDLPLDEAKGGDEICIK